MPLTSPWMEMNLPTEGGVVEASDDLFLVVNFPATPVEAMPGLGIAFRDTLVAHGWSVAAVNQDDANGLAVMMRTNAGGEATLDVLLHRGRPRVQISAL